MRYDRGLEEGSLEEEDYLEEGCSGEDSGLYGSLGSGLNLEELSGACPAYAVE